MIMKNIKGKTGVLFWILCVRHSQNGFDKNNKLFLPLYSFVKKRATDLGPYPFSNLGTYRMDLT